MWRIEGGLAGIVERLETLAGPSEAVDEAIEAWKAGGYVDLPPHGPTGRFWVREPSRSFTGDITTALAFVAWEYPNEPLALIANASACSASWLPRAPASGLWPRGTATAPSLPIAICLAVLRRKLEEMPA